MTGLAHEVMPGVWADLHLEGDIFEMEDQRNWTDASFKTFSTPLRIPYPVEIGQGTRIRQAVTLALRHEWPGMVAAPAVSDGALAFTVDRDRPAIPLPPIGLGVASHGEPLTETELTRLAALSPSHLRVDLTLSDPQFGRRLSQAAQEAARLDTSLEVALFVDPSNAAVEAAALRTAIDALDPPVVRWLVFPEREMFKGGSLMREALEAVLPVIANDRGVPVISGTNADFIFMGRNVPPLELVDALSFAITAEVHAFDNASIVETLGTQAQAVGSGRALAQGKPVYVSPITFKMRHNPYATAAAPPTPPGQLPSQVDPRQMSLFAAGWTAASIKHVAEAGAAGITYFETTGWRGVMETAAGSPVPDKFVSIPGGVFPAYHVLADVGEFSGGQVIPSRSADRLAVDGLALRKDDRLRVLVANMTAEPQNVIVRGLPAELEVRVLDAANAEAAMQAPEAFRAAAGQRMAAADGALTLELPPYAVARLDA